MIEYRYEYEKTWTLFSLENIKYLSNAENYWKSLDFSDYKIRVGGDVFACNSKTFIKSIRKELFWEKLRSG